MRLDAADLAILEIDLPKLDPLAHAIAQHLIDRIREDGDEVERAKRAVDTARDCAKDAGIALGHLRHYFDDSLEDTRSKADRYADEIESALDDIQEIDL